MPTHAVAGRPKVNGEQVDFGNRRNQEVRTQKLRNLKQSCTLKVASCLWFLNLEVPKQVNLWFLFLRPARPFVVSKPFQQPGETKDANTLMYERGNPYVLQGMKKKGQKGLGFGGPKRFCTLHKREQ